MKSIYRSTLVLVAGSLILLSCLAIQASAEPVSQVIQVLQVKGQGRYSSDNKTWHSLKKGEVLRPGVMIQTAGKSSVDLQLSDRDTPPTSLKGPDGLLRTPDELKANTIRVYDNSVLSIDTLTSDRNGSDEVTETQLDLRAGRIMGGVRTSSTGSRYEIKYLKGVVGVRGGIYLMRSTGELDVLYGMAIIAQQVAGGSTPAKRVGANEQFDPATGLVTEIRSTLPVETAGVDSKPAASSSAPTAPPFQGAGMGGSLRKF